VLAGRPAELDVFGRLVYAARSGERNVEVFDFRSALPDTGASTVCRLGESSVAARETLVEALEERWDEPVPPAAPAPPAPAARGRPEPRIGGDGRRLLLSPGRSSTVVPRARAAGARALARARRL